MLRVAAQTTDSTAVMLAEAVCSRRSCSGLSVRAEVRDLQCNRPRGPTPLVDLPPKRPVGPTSSLTSFWWLPSRAAQAGRDGGSRTASPRPPPAGSPASNRLPTPDLASTSRRTLMSTGLVANLRILTSAAEKVKRRLWTRRRRFANRPSATPKWCRRSAGPPRTIVAMKTSATRRYSWLLGFRRCRCGSGLRSALDRARAKHRIPFELDRLVRNVLIETRARSSPSGASILRASTREESPELPRHANRSHHAECEVDRAELAGALVFGEPLVDRRFSGDVVDLMRCWRAVRC